MPTLTTSYRVLVGSLCLGFLGFAQAEDYSKSVQLNALVEFLAYVDDYNAADGNAFVIRSEDDVRVAGTSLGTDRSWSIWSNSPAPVSVTFDLPAIYKDGSRVFLLHDTASPGPNNEHRVDFYLNYVSCTGSSSVNIGGSGSGAIPFGSSFTLSPSEANRAACQTAPGNLVIGNDAMTYRPYLGIYTAHVTVTIADPGEEGVVNPGGNPVYVPPAENGPGVISIN